MGRLETAVVALLRADETVAGLVAARIHPIYLPETATLPAIAYQITDKQELHSSGGLPQTVNPTMQITCFALTYAEVVELADAVRDELNTFQGTSDDVFIQRILLTDQADVPNVSPDNDQLRIYGRRLNFEIWNVE